MSIEYNEGVLDYWKLPNGEDIEKKARWWVGMWNKCKKTQCQFT